MRVNFNTIALLNFKTFNSKRISFKGNNKDIFFTKNSKNSKYQTKQIERKNAIKPNVKFIYDTSLTIDERIQELKKHPELMPVKKSYLLHLLGLNKRDGEGEKINRFFETDGIEPYFLCLDMSNEQNKKNLEFLEEKRPHSYTVSELSNTVTGIAYSKIERYIKRGKFIPLELQTLNGEKETLPLFDIEDEQNINCIKRMQKSTNKKSKYLLKSYMKECYVPFDVLLKHGFGKKDELDKAINSKKVKAKTDEKTGEILIDIARPITREYLKDLRKNNEDFIIIYPSSTGIISYDELTDAIEDDKVQPIGEYILEREASAYAFDLTDEKNKKFFKDLQEKNKKLNDTKGNKKTFYAVNQKKVQAYEKAKQNFPNSAFLYDYTLTDEEVKEELSKKPEIVPKKDLAALVGVNRGGREYSILEKIFNQQSRDLKVYVDLSEEANKERYEYIKEKRAHSYTKSELIAQKKYSPNILNKLIQEGVLKPVEVKTRDNQLINLPLFDIEDEGNKQALESAKIKPRPVFQDKPDAIVKRAKILNTSNQFIPFAYIEKLGFASHEELINAVKSGVLRPVKKMFTKMTPEGEKVSKELWCVDITDSRNKSALFDLRLENDNISEAKELAKELAIKTQDLIDAIKEGKISVIPEYLFKEDSKKLFVDLSNEQNKEVLDELVDKALKEKERKANLASLRFKIVNCMLNHKKVSKYEYIATNKKASRIVKKYEEKGIDAIDDENIKRLILNFESQNEGNTK